MISTNEGINVSSGRRTSTPSVCGKSMLSPEPSNTGFGGGRKTRKTGRNQGKWEGARQQCVAVVMAASQQTGARTHTALGADL